MHMYQFLNLVSKFLALMNYSFTCPFGQDSTSLKVVFPKVIYHKKIHSKFLLSLYYILIS